MAGSAKDVQAFLERVATDWDTMRIAYYDERVIEKSDVPKHRRKDDHDDCRPHGVDRQVIRLPPFEVRE
ncbi:MAG TPA: hypothetical protein VHF70_03885, partial [Rubrobacteraceae bacterium]|nr:hypothetical protein [Rubrobacteraceae bacterium]